MTGNGPAVLATGLERRSFLPHDGKERMTSYGILGLPFASGDILAFRRATASSIGPPYSSIWHRDPGGRWTFYSDIEPGRSCARYFDTRDARRVESVIRIEWLDPFRLALSIPAHHLDWTVGLEATTTTIAFNALQRLVPGRLGRVPVIGGSVAAAGSRILRAGPLRFRGSTPTGHRFTVCPFRVWAATAAAAIVGGRDIGPIAARGAVARLGDFVLPDRGLFAAAGWSFLARNEVSG